MAVVIVVTYRRRRQQRQDDGKLQDEFNLTTYASIRPTMEPEHYDSADSVSEVRINSSATPVPKTPVVSEDISDLDYNIDYSQLKIVRDIGQG